MRDVTRIMKLAESSSGLSGLTYQALNLLLALTNAENMELVGWDGRALAYMLGTATCGPCTGPSLCLDLALESEWCLCLQRDASEAKRQRTTY